MEENITIERRQGEGRRMEDQHCGNHERNTSDIAKLSGSLNTYKWVIGISMPVLLLILSIFYTDISAKFDKMQSSIDKLSLLVQSKAEADSALKVKVDYIERDLQLLKDKINRK